MGRVLSQGEIDNMLSSLLQDTTVLPNSETAESAPQAAQNAADAPSTLIDSEQPVIPAGIAAFKAKLAAAQAAREAEAAKTKE